MKHRRRQNCRARIDPSLSIPEQQLSTSGRFKDNITGVVAHCETTATPGSSGTIESFTSMTRECVLILSTTSRTTGKKAAHYAERAGFRVSTPQFDGIRIAVVIRGAGDDELQQLANSLSADKRTRRRWSIEFRDAARNSMGSDNHAGTRMRDIAYTENVDSKTSCSFSGLDSTGGHARRRDYSVKPGKGSGEPFIDGTLSRDEYDHTNGRTLKPLTGPFHKDNHSSTT